LTSKESTSVTFFYSGETCLGFRAQGHAGNAPQGENIVCAAVSAILQTAYLGLTEVASLQPQWRADEETALMECIIHENTQADIILRTARVGIAAIARQHPHIVKLSKEEYKNV